MHVVVHAYAYACDYACDYACIRYTFYIVIFSTIFCKLGLIYIANSMPEPKKFVSKNMLSKESAKLYL